ncbi:hypothetical protein R1sor_023093 [Riccia sorocarpa]|uniref:Reverse transcriptase n=1 Tax=Riccia sorocarpa TaxID=122646 RepID=A0ABD3GPR0_9MARC
MLRDKDEEDARIWRLRSRAKWLAAGDAPTKYFFSLWKTKASQDDLRVLQLEDGTLTEDKAHIMLEVGNFYKKLYQEEGDSPQDCSERRLVLSGITKKGTAEANHKLEVVPTEQELIKCVGNLASDKAPGLDGVSADVLQETWEEVKPLCLEMASEENFYAAKSIVEKFEQISSAKLNVAKSLFIPIRMESIPRWMFNTGCRIASEGEVWMYLGVPMGVKVTEEQLEVFLLKKMTKKLHHWSNRLLTWEGLCTVLKHAFMSIPNYYLMTLGLTLNGYRKLDRTCWQFLSGKNTDGIFKRPLIAWDQVCRKKAEGGLGLCTFRDQAVVLKTRMMSRLLSVEVSEWATSASGLLERNFHRKRVNHGKDRSAVQILLLDTPRKVTISRTSDHIVQSWSHGRNNLLSALDTGLLRSDMKLEVVLRLGEVVTNRVGKDWTVVRRRYKVMGLKELRELEGRPLDRLSAADRLGSLPDTGGYTMGPPSDAFSFLEKCVANASTDGHDISWPGFLKWIGDPFSEIQVEWGKANRIWRELIRSPYKLRKKMNASWGKK